MFCHRKGREVLRADGTPTPIEDLRVGDLVVSPSGGWVPVTALHRGRGPMAEVRPHRGGDPFVVTLDHELTLIATPGHSRPSRRGGREGDHGGRWPIAQRPVHHRDAESLKAQTRYAAPAESSGLRLVSGPRAVAAILREERRVAPDHPIGDRAGRRGGQRMAAAIAAGARPSLHPHHSAGRHALRDGLWGQDYVHGHT